MQSVEPRVTGTLSWTAAGELTFDHAPLNPATQYRVVLDAGYRDARGSTNGLRHSWTFQTEGPPVLAGSSPGGKIYKISPAGKVLWTYDSGEKYVWALTFDRQGALYAATGIEGRVLKVDAEGHGKVFFDAASVSIRLGTAQT